MRDFMVYGDFTIRDLSNGELLDCTTSTGFLLDQTRWGETGITNMSLRSTSTVDVLAFPKLSLWWID